MKLYFYLKEKLFVDFNFDLFGFFFNKQKKLNFSGKTFRLFFKFLASLFFVFPLCDFERSVSFLQLKNAREMEQVDIFLILGSSVVFFLWRQFSWLHPSLVARGKCI